MQFRTLSLALIGAGVLSACGGGGGGTRPPVIDTGTVTLTGVAARGAALAGATITAKCAAGTNTATAGADGSYTMVLNDAALPCVLSASGDGQLLHSVATGSGAGTATANITTLTELLVAQLSGNDPAAFATATSGAALATALTSDAVGAAQTAVVSTLTAAGVDTSALGNLVTGSLVAANGSTAGNGYDQVLDALSAALASAGSTLVELTATVAATSAASSGSTTPPTSSTASQLPADLLLKPKAANCASLRSTSYRLFVFKPSDTTGAGDPVTATGTFDIDATALTETGTGADAGYTSQWEAGPEACTFTADGGSTTITVSPAGVLVARFFDDATSSYRMVMAVPMQDIPLSALAGSWNTLGWSPGSSRVVQAGTATLNASGQVTSAVCFDDVNPLASGSCSAVTGPLPSLAVNAGGGFDLVSGNSSEPWRDRWFAYRSGTGDLMVMSLNAYGDFSLFTPNRARSLPTVGNVSGVWNIGVNNGGAAVDLVSKSTHTITGVDAGTGTVTRNSINDTLGGTNTVSVPQTLRINDPRDGYTYRLSQSVTASDGSAQTVREFHALTLYGMGLSAVYLPNIGSSPNARFLVSVSRPQP